MTFNLCANCGNEALEEITVPYIVEYCGKQKTIQDRRTRCPACESLTYQGSQISDHEHAVAAAERELGGLLSADELRNIRLKYRLKQTEIEQMLCTGPKTWTRWERGKVTQSKATDQLIRVIAENPDVARKLMEDAGITNAEATAIFDQIEYDSKRIAIAALKQEWAMNSQMSIDTFLDRFSDKAFERVRQARELASAGMRAA